MGELGITPQRAWEVPRQLARLAEDAGVQLTEGIPRFTWNGMSDDLTHLVKNGVGEDVHLLFPGLHPAAAGEAELRFAWSPRRQQLWGQMLDKLPALRDEAGATHLVGGGSFFHSDKAAPGDIDVLAIVPGGAPGRFAQGRRAVDRISDHPDFSGIHVRAISDSPRIGYSQELLANEGLISTARHAEGQLETGTVLLNIDDVLGHQRAR